MAEFIIGKVYFNELNLLRRSTKHYPLELQLIWLFEILVIWAYEKMLGEGTSFRISTSGRHIMSQGRCITYVSSHISDMDVMQLLSDFRNTYVHCGCYGEAEDIFKEIVKHHLPGIKELATNMRISLNTTYTMYSHEEI